MADTEVARLNVGIEQHVVSGARRQLAAEMQRHHPVGHGPHQRHVVVDDEHGRARLVPEHLRSPFVNRASGKLARLVEGRDERIAPEHAALTEPLAVGVHAVAKANVRGDEVPLVIGCGPVGLAVIAALKLKGLHPIVAADYSPARRALAEKLGAEIVVDPARTQPYATWAEHAQMSPEQKAARPPLQALLPALKPALIFECVGIPGLIQRVFEGAPRDARIVVVGVCMETDRSEPMLGILKELNVQYVLGYTPDEFAYSLRLIAEGEVDAASLVTATVGIDGVAGAFADLANPERHTKIIVEPWR